MFELNRKGLNLQRGVTLAAATMLLPLIVLTALHLERYWISMSFGALFVWLSDPAGWCRPWSLSWQPWDAPWSPGFESRIGEVTMRVWPPIGSQP